MLWIAKGMKPSAQQSQVLTQLATVLQIIGVRRRNSEPLTTAREIANMSTQNSKTVDSNIAVKPVDNTHTYAERHFGQHKYNVIIIIKINQNQVSYISLLDHGYFDVTIKCQWLAVKASRTEAIPSK